MQDENEYDLYRVMKSVCYGELYLVRSEDQEEFIRIDRYHNTAHKDPRFHCVGMSGFIELPKETKVIQNGISLRFQKGE